METRDERRAEALELVGRAYRAQMKGDLDEALALYDASIEAFPTPEAYTYRGWARSARREFEAAIADCHRAIDLDPEFGNPYNDIGAYYLEMGEAEEAIPWLRMALKAKRYENTCFPHYNLGRAAEALGRPEEALPHYREALIQNPAFLPALRAAERLTAQGTPAPPPGGTP